MPVFPLTVGMLLSHSRWVHHRSEVVTAQWSGVRRASFAEVAERADRLAGALARLGVERGDRVGTFMWNTQQHLEAYLAVPSMGAVLHTVNIRLDPEQIAYVIDHAGDKVLLVDASVAALLAPVADRLTSVEEVVVVGDADSARLGDRRLLAYETLLDEAPPGGSFAYPEVAEGEPAAMCYTSGTTGNPRGVVYSHRSVYLHAMAVCMGQAFALTEHDRVLPIVPMFHANAWGLPYAAWMAGADLVMPGRLLQAEPLCELIAAERPTVSGAVPTIWNDVVRFAERHPVDLSSLRLVLCGGSAVPRRLMERLEAEHGVHMVQAWGMTETSPLAAIAHPPRHAVAGTTMDYRVLAGRVHPGVQLRVVDGSGSIVACDGRSVGEIEVRGPWVTASYHDEDTPDKFHDGWLRTGDVGTVDDQGYVKLTDRTKDVIKSGGEWISSVDLENAIMAHPGVVEAAVVAVPDERWGERPLACVVVDDPVRVTAAVLRAHVATLVARWWVPERWAFIDEVPKTSVGKFDKKLLRRHHHEGRLTVVDDNTGPPSPEPEHTKPVPA